MVGIVFCQLSVRIFCFGPRFLCFCDVLHFVFNIVFRFAFSLLHSPDSIERHADWCNFVFDFVFYFVFIFSFQKILDSRISACPAQGKLTNIEIQFPLPAGIPFFVFVLGFCFSVMHSILFSILFSVLLSPSSPPCPLSQGTP